MHEYTPCRDSNWGAIVANMFARGGRRAFRGNVFFRVKCLPTYRLVIMAKKDGTFDIQLRYEGRNNGHVASFEKHYTVTLSSD